jgi:hypothetical protein
MDRKPIAPDTLIERLTRLANAHHVDSDAAAEAKAALEANNRQLQLYREALDLTRNRLRAAAINEAPNGGSRYYEYSEWADEADASIASIEGVGK